MEESAHAFSARGTFWLRILVASLPGLVSATTGLLLTFSVGWAAVGVPAGDDPFGDLSVALAGAECAGAGFSWTLSDEPCNPLSAIYNYPAIWAVGFSALGLGVPDAQAVAIAMILAFSLSLSCLAFLASGKPETFRTLVMVLVGVSPPVLLAFQRGNIDLVIFTLVVLASVLLIRQHSVMSGVIIGLTVSLKLFPVGALSMFVSGRHINLRAAVPAALVSLLGTIWIARDFHLISDRTPLLDGASFGASLLPLVIATQLAFGWDRLSSLIIGVFLFLLGIVVVTVLTRLHTKIGIHYRDLVESINADPVSRILFAAGTGTFLVAYLFGPSFDYRLIFMIPVVAALLRSRIPSSVVLATCAVATIFLSYSEFIGPFEYLGDFLLLALAPLLATLLFVVVGNRQAVADPTTSKRRS